MKVAVVGYGNVGKFAVQAVEAADDAELVGVVRRNVGIIPDELKKYPVVNNIDQLKGVDVALLCGPTRSVPEMASSVLARGINTVDSFDIHGQIYHLKKQLDVIAKKNNATAIISAGWDPGSDSMVRSLFKAIVPFGITYTNFGPGMSMGHSVVAKSKTGVKDALSMTMPLGDGIHRRLVYLEMESGADFDLACKEIKADDYFAHDDTRFFKVDDIRTIIDMGHGVHMCRKGVSGKSHNQLLDFNMRINNPALTSQIMLACARATMKMEPGAYTTIEVPIIKMLPGNEEDLIRELV